VAGLQIGYCHIPSEILFYHGAAVLNNCGPQSVVGGFGIWMGVRRFTRLTNAFSKKFENHCHMVAIYHAYYNFCRVHQTLRVTPAMEAGLTDHVWTLQELVCLLEYKELTNA
jgi:hypothetical protein